MWVDMMTPAEASRFPVVDVSPPTPLDIEIRVIVWKTRDVISGDEITGLSDLYTKVWMDGVAPQKTDTHLR
jgi:hypothetical protein